MKSRHLVLFAMLILQAWAHGEDAEVRKWVSSKGTVIEGKLMEYLPDRLRQQHSRVRIETPDGRTITVPMYQLSSNDQDWVSNHRPLEEIPPSNDSGIKVHPLTKVDCSEPKDLLVPPAGTSFDRAAIPSLGEYENAGSDPENLLANHLFWLSKAGYTRTEMGRDESRTWEKFRRKADGGIGSGGVSDSQKVADFVVKMIEREGKDIISVRQWQPKLVSLAGFEAISGKPTMVLFEGRAYRGETYKWSVVFPVLEAKGKEITLFYRGERVRAEISDLSRDETKAGGVKIEDGSYRYGYKLVLKPDFSKKLVKECVDEQVEIHMECGSFRIIDFELSPPAERKP